MAVVTENKIRKAMTWFTKKVTDLFKGKDAVQDRKKSLDINEIGDVGRKMAFFNMYVHAYANPLWEEELKFYDKLPLYFPIDMVGPNHGNGAKIRALNIHYLEPSARKIFVENMFEVINRALERLGYDIDEDGYDKVAYGNLTKIVGKHANKIYLGLEGSNDIKKLRMCYRSYFLDRIGSKIQRIKLSEWQNAVDLIQPQFMKASRSEVYSTIDEQYKKYKSRNWSSIY